SRPARRRCSSHSAATASPTIDSAPPLLASPITWSSRSSWRRSRRCSRPPSPARCHRSPAAPLQSPAMIDYDARRWLGLILPVRGSVVPRLVPRVLATSAIGVVAMLLLERRGLRIPTLAHTLVGVALGLLLVFRTNASYDRYWEGRRLIGGIVNRARDLARQ